MTQERVPQERPELWAVLSGLRFVLAMIVVCRHLETFTPIGGILNHISRLSAPTAVFCFLVISGYSIGHSLNRQTHHFYRRRMLRIYPLYALAILVSVGTAKFIGVGGSENHSFNIVANLLFLQTFVAATLATNAVVWSLGVEIACYVAAPLFHRMTTRGLLMITGISAAAFVVFPHSHLAYYAWLSHGIPLLCIGWAWLAGFIYYRHRTHAHAGIMLLIAAIVLTTFNSEFAGTWQHITIAGSIGLLVMGNSIELSRQSQKLLNYLGSLSFPLYLIHYPMYRLCLEKLHTHSAAVSVGTALTAAAIGLVIDAQLHGPCAAACEWMESAINQLLAGTRVFANRVAIAVQVPQSGFSAMQLVRPISIVIAMIGCIFYVAHLGVRRNQGLLAIESGALVQNSSSPRP